MEYTVYHTQEKRKDILTEPVLGQGHSQWLGDGFYFWQDDEFAIWWGDNKKCGIFNKSRQFSIYKAELQFEKDEFIDSVFDEKDYYGLVRNVEKFAISLSKNLGRKPTLEEFNDFVHDKSLWQDIKVIRFQDLPHNEQFIQVKGFYYKKRIQFRITDLSIIKRFIHFNDFDCLNS